MPSITYTTPAVIAQRRILAERLLTDRRLRAVADDQCDRIAQAICARLGQRPYMLAEDGQSYATVWATDIDDALQAAVDGVDRAAYADAAYADDEGDGSTIWVDAQATDMISGESVSETVTLEPDEPDCADGHDHDWQSPHEVVGGDRANPGVYGHGGGVVITEVCRHCGCYRVQDTWAQRRDTGEQGLESTTYREANDRSRAWVDSLRVQDTAE